MLLRNNMVYLYALRYDAIITNRNDRCLFENMTLGTERIKFNYTDKDNKVLKDMGLDTEEDDVEEI